MSYLSLFTFFMLILVTSDNFFQLFLGWEGVGLCSYLLINFWYYRLAANKAAIKAMLMNRIADVFFIFGIILLLYEFKSLNFFVIFSLLEFVEFINYYVIFASFTYIDLVVFFLCLGAIGKSAQLGLHTWLADAMEGPTPVSSLLHAATMVTAGVFLLIRCSFLFEKSNSILFFILFLGSFTAFFFSLVGVFQYDIKKIIAYSTCSQLGYMFFSCGLSNYHITLFHLFNHAFFKALLFLGAGSIIFSIVDEQDFRKFGFLVKKLPLTYISIIIGSLAILGFPFLAGFYSKDILLEYIYITYSIDGIYIYSIGIITAMFTAIYSFKLIFFSFLYKSNFFTKYLVIKEDNIYIGFVLFCLSSLSIFIGFLFSDIFLGLGNIYFDNSIYIFFDHYNYFDNEFLHPFIKNCPIICSLIGIGIAYIMFYKYSKKKILYIYALKRYIYLFFFSAGFFNFFYEKIFLSSFFIFYIIQVKIIEKGYLELLGPNGFYLFLRYISISSRGLSPRFINLIILLIYLFIIIILYYIYLDSIMYVYSIFFLFFFYYIFE